jgi:hypothetical protein
MKTKAIYIALIFVLAISTVAMAASVTPITVDPWTSRDAAFECGQVGDYDFAYKVDDWNVDDKDKPIFDGNGAWTHAGQTITISNSNGYTFDWAVNPYPLGAVIVKAGTGALVYYYEGVSSDTGLYAPSGKAISHATFCWDKTDRCYEEETAWAEGERYVKKGNWAMYVEYEAGKTVDLIADFTNYVHAGTVTFSAPVDGKVTITVNLTDGAIFYYDLNDPLYDNNFKVMDYAKAPTKTPAPGLFTWKTNIETGSITGSIVVPVNNFYGVHLDIALPVPCE